MKIVDGRKFEKPTPIIWIFPFHEQDNEPDEEDASHLTIGISPTIDLEIGDGIYDSMYHEDARLLADALVMAVAIMDAVDGNPMADIPGVEKE